MELAKVINFQQNPDLELSLVPKNKNKSKSGFSSKIDDFLTLYRKNKTGNRKSGSNKVSGNPKAVQNRSKHSLRVPELDAPLAWSYWNFRNFQNLKIILKISTFFEQNFPISPKNIFGRKKIGKYFWPRKKKYFFEHEKKSRGIASMQKIHSFRLVRFSERFRHSDAS